MSIRKIKYFCDYEPLVNCKSKFHPQGIAMKNDLIKVEYGTSEDLDDKITEQIREFGNSACYYVSGPGKM